VPNSDKMLWPYPNKDTDPWFDIFESMVTAMDSSGYSAREDRSIIWSGGGDVTWDAGSNTLTWPLPFVAFSMIAGFKLTIPAGSVTIADGEVLYVTLTRSPTTNVSIGVVPATSVPNTNEAMAVAVRTGTTVYFRWGSKIETGETLNLFAVSGGGNSDVYEREATFGVPLGSSTDEATLGRIIVFGSVVGLSAELTRPVTTGTVTVNLKVNGITKMTVQLSLTNTTFIQATAAPGVVPIASGDQVSIQVVASSYSNADSLDSGLTVNVLIGSGITIPPSGIPDASDSTEGITRLSVAPVLPSSPIAVGNNDPRLSENRRIVYTVTQPADGTDFFVTITPTMSSPNYIVLHTLATVSVHVTVSVPLAGRAVGQFNVKTNAALGNGDTIYFHVVGI